MAISLEKLAETLKLSTILIPDSSTEIETAYTSDLLSDVMAHAPAQSALITIQAHKNTIAVATLAGIKAIIICNKRQIPDDMIDAAQQEGIAILGTEEDQFTISGKLYTLLKDAKV
ncbi:hypothetical protein WKV44_07855 [Spirochaetia bacterium 38H-sp]|uniref:DRTGG domain-containing protein n=1 Tax=Rarispira pelagica TaxID=3141764 RepID=A0ABU9UCQ7_9SPIR